MEGGRNITIITVALLAIIAVIHGGLSAASQASQKEPEIIVGHTRGLISVRSSIRVLFTREMVPKERVGTPISDSPILFEPAIEGQALWKDARTLLFRPAQMLPRGRHYKATLTLADQDGGSQAQKVSYEFQFATLKQAFTIQVDGFNTPHQKRSRILRLRGRITTADWESPDKIMGLLTARQGDRGLNLKWVHGEEGRLHQFTVDRIRRQEGPTQVVLKWDGTLMGVDRKGQRSIDVPAMGPFKALSVRAVSGETQHIEIRFSDPLDKDQDLKGLLRMDDLADLRWEIEGSIVRVYGTKRWHQSVQLEVAAGVRNYLGKRLGEKKTFAVNFEEIGPQVRFVGKGNIVPTTTGLTLPIEAINLRKVMVEAIRVDRANMPQFLQVNPLSGDREITRVGRSVWKKSIPLDHQVEDRNRWRRFGLDLSELTRNHPGGLYILRLTFRRPHILHACEESGPEWPGQMDTSGETWDAQDESSYWDSVTQNQNFNWNQYYNQRKNPCHPAYYMPWHDHKIVASRNVIISDIGLLAKKGSANRVFVAATDLKTAGPLVDTDIQLLDYQKGLIATARTDSQGVAFLDAGRKPFLVVARKGEMEGFLRVDEGSALSVSHFDVSGHGVTGGLKGYLYGERGVWRPGDPIYLTFILMPSSSVRNIPAEHPVIFELRDPKGQLVQKKIRTDPLNGFYTFKTQTAADAPTGNWRATVRVGGAVFEKRLKIETVRPNRLKISLQLDGEPQSLTKGNLEGRIAARWLHGAVVRDLKTDLAISFQPRPTRFEKFPEFNFDDPVRKYRPEREEIYAGRLDQNGAARFEANIETQNVSPGMLTAGFRARVFEAGGGFSIDHMHIPYHPFDRYVGIRVPKGDKARGMLLTDTDHTVRLALLDQGGQPIPKAEVEVSLYKIKWRWWWEKEPEAMADYIGTDSYAAIKTETVAIVNGTGRWRFQVNYPAWGRYLIRVKDKKGKHITGKIVYIDWPGWAGRAREDIPGGASVLTLSADKDKYHVGDRATVTIPAGRRGRVLVSLENGSRILATQWLEADGKDLRHRFEITPEMAPNIFVHVTHLQPHLAAGNDLPIRMYGIIPIAVDDPETLLKPEIEAPAVFRPEEKAALRISEARGRAMTYTVAVVDEGLLDLTRFATPDPRKHFYRRDALGVKTWDLFDSVAGAYGGILEQLLSVGGDAAGRRGEAPRANRFPPMVRFLGPFHLKAHKTAAHEIDIPQYVGSVRVMVVAGQKRAFGFAQRAVPVRKPLMVLASLPRVVSPQETVELPVTVFAMDDAVKNVRVALKAEGPIAIQGPSQQSITFSQPGDDILPFKLRGLSKTGPARLFIAAASKDEHAGQTIEFDLRHPGNPVVDVFAAILDAGESWNTAIALPGVPGTNQATLEVSRIPPLNLARRLDFLIRYPHGCAEQTTSAVFPQLYLGRLMDLPKDASARIENNIRAAIQRLKGFQTAQGGFGYWPQDERAQEWSSNYVGHFLLEAQRAGYLLPPELLSKWKVHQRRQARRWSGNQSNAAAITQAYRLFSLALAGSCELGAMNRLRETRGLSTVARFRLAAAYELCGQGEAARRLTDGQELSFPVYRELSNTFGSDIRDKAMVVEALTILGQSKRAFPLVEEISRELCRDQWMSTQTIAYALIAVAGHAGIAAGEGELRFDWHWRGHGATVSKKQALVQIPLSLDQDDPGTQATIPIGVDNLGKIMLYPRVVIRGLPAPGTEKAADNGLALKVEYLNPAEEPIDPRTIEQGSDFLVRVFVKNTGNRGTYEEVALAHLFASGWEIENRRLAEGSALKAAGWDYQDIRDDRVYTYFDLEEGQTKQFSLGFNAAYRGRFYLPMISVEAMYEATINARMPGHWMEVVRPGETD
jgi:uncharacterized protein YfaS (alpha-2-macroglobulin family)